MFLDSFMEFLSIGVSFTVGVILGVIIGYSSFDYAARAGLRKRLEREHPGAARFTKILVASRKETRERIFNAIGEITAPMLDTAGVVMDAEERRFTVRIVDISKNGIGILSQDFLRLGLKVQIACKAEKINFSFLEAEVRNSVLAPTGLRIGLQFLKPLESL